MGASGGRGKEEEEFTRACTSNAGKADPILTVNAYLPRHRVHNGQVE